VYVFSPQGRATFGALGWNKVYDFTDGDLAVCVAQTKMFLETFDTIPFAVMRFLCGEINYGGRVTDEHDRRVVTALLVRISDELEGLFRWIKRNRS
jgi:dynein heavy chain